ncbi:hypothetical protein [Roseburia sp. 499]|uniref:hypothetical protein n=1 Tax=Roseburia sp. 499 TaxID=1261634 RepID=UPI000950F31A|nr:hypothetical protein [Roseburia sp. 499]WVK68648.1 hypothetical protein BIV20_09625 [Roseburia sp. 499]
MLLDKLNSGRSVFSTDFGETKGKTIGEFSNEEWDKLLSKVDNALEAYKEDLKEREEEAKEQQKKKAETAALCRNVNEEFEQNVMRGGVLQSMRFQRLNESMFSSEQEEEENIDMENSVNDFVSEEAIQKIVGNRGKMPYSTLADENGIIEYNGVTFVGDMDSNSLCLGDMTNPDNVLTIQLSDGGYLKVNLDNLDSLSKAIGMFSPEDQNRIMRALAQYNKLKQIQQQIEDETSGLQVLKKGEDVAFYA